MRMLFSCDDGWSRGWGGPDILNGGWGGGPGASFASALEAAGSPTRLSPGPGARLSEGPDRRDGADSGAPESPV